MHRRSFIKFLGVATIGSTIAYSFPSIIVPKNIEDINAINDLSDKMEIWPEIVNDMFFTDRPELAFLSRRVPPFDANTINRFDSRIAFRGYISKL